MTGREEGRRLVEQAIFADEVGIEYGIFGDYRLRSAYQPIFAPRGGLLAPVAVEALIEPHRAGRAVPPAAFFQDVAAAERPYVEAMCRTLHLRNFRNIGVEGIDLFFSYDPRIGGRPGRALAEIRLRARHLGEIELEPGMLVCAISEQAAAGEALLPRMVREMRRNGLRIAIDGFGAGHSSDERLRLVEPDIVKMDGAWFAELCRHAAAERLFRPLVGLLHDRGARVLVAGIEQPLHLQIALEGGADLLQGPYLAKPALAGTIFREEPLDIDFLLRRSGKILPFPLMHQRR
jgi:EAL domain-containing protein (putative c-di-GMP-specific phosphodiesterase class I)